MYANISTSKLTTIIEKACQDNHIDEKIKLDIIKLTNTVINQNCFQFGGDTYIQMEGLTMGAPTSSILSEFYLQHLETTNIYNTLLEHNIVGYFRYVDDILIIYNHNKTKIEGLLKCFNTLHPKLEFTIEKETDEKINFLDITVTRKPNHFYIDIYRKPTYTDAIIPSDSCHPFEHKIAAIRYLNNRMISYQLPPEGVIKEHNKIKRILENNKYDTSILKTLNNKNQKKRNDERTQWAKFTYTRKGTRIITKLFKNTNIKVSFTTNNTIEKLLKTEHQNTTNKYEKCGIYRLTCPTCNMKYVGQTGSHTEFGSVSISVTLNTGTENPSSLHTFWTTDTPSTKRKIWNQRT